MLKNQRSVRLARCGAVPRLMIIAGPNGSGKSTLLNTIVMDQYEIDVFEELFYADLESWFSADIACCDRCYDEFISDWPHAYGANEAEFQKAGISLDTFYSGSRLQEVYTPEQFSELIGRLVCPRCLSNLEHNIWAYELPFAVPRTFAANVDAVVRAAMNTPFLLLENEFCREVLSAISDLAKRSKKRKFSEPIFRGRDSSNGAVAQELEQFGAAPREVVSEGRYPRWKACALLGQRPSNLPRGIERNCMHCAGVYPY